MSSTTDASLALTRAALEQKHPVAEYFRTEELRWWPQACASAEHFIPRLGENFLTIHEVELLQGVDSTLCAEGEEDLLDQPNPEAEIVLGVVLAGMVEYYRRNLVKMYPLGNPNPYPRDLSLLLRDMLYSHPEDASPEESIDKFDLMTRAHQWASTIVRRKEVGARANALRQNHRALLEALKSNPELQILTSGRVTAVLQCSEDELVKLELACLLAESYVEKLDRGGVHLHEWYCVMREQLVRKELKEALRGMPSELLRPLINPTDDQTSHRDLLLKLAALDSFCRLSDDIRNDEQAVAA
ncbi:hypothetical protein EPO04_02085 [Patescibacteria group bacterium]|nr:MAG: hypothetical protein EPO04_02085 [Patescibacteria group bacterium]